MECRPDTSGDNGMSKITKSARGQECQVRIPGICNHNPETVVFAHLGGGGMGMKRGSNEGAYCCSSCHDALDWRLHHDIPMEKIKLWHLEAVMRTQKILIEKGLLVLIE